MGDCERYFREHRVGGVYELPLSHHRTCRSAYGGSVWYFNLFNASVCSQSITSCILYHIRFNYFTYRLLKGTSFQSLYLTVRSFPKFSSVLWPLLTSHSSLLLCLVSDNAYSSAPARPHGINQYSFLVYLPDLHIKVTVTFWTSLPFANLSA